LKVTVERTQPDEAIVTVEVDAPRVDQAIADALRHLSQRYVFPGFRRGKAPRHIVESFLGRDAVRQEALSHLVEATFYEAVDGEGLRVVGQADLEETPDLETGRPITYKARVAVQPPIDFGDVRSLPVTVERREVSDDDVQAAIESMRRQHAKLVDADKVGEHALVQARVWTEIGGEVVETPRETMLDMDEGDPVVTGLAQALVGSPVGETRQVVWTVPADHPEHAGEEAVTHIEVLAVRDRELPAIDDALAGHLGAQSVDELRVKVRQYLEAQERRLERERRLDSAVTALVQGVTAPVPEPLVERQSDILWEEFLQELRRQRIPLEAYMAAAGQDEAAVRAGFRSQAEWRAKRNMVLEALALAQGLEPLDGEILAAADRLLGSVEKGPRHGKRTLSRGQRAYIRDVLLREKALNFLADIYAPGDDEEAGDDGAEAAETAQAAADPQPG
jgi:trigger factor